MMNRRVLERRSSNVVAAITFFVVLSVALKPSPTNSFLYPAPTSRSIPNGRFQRTAPVLHAEKEGSMSEEEIKRQLTEYLQKRKEVNADDAAKAIKGKVVGGTRGNAVLEYISGAPAKEQVIERAPDVFDYDELSRYGYSNLVKPIMDNVGGRRAVYDLMGMEPPPLQGPPPKKVVPKLVIDRTGEEDKARYTGLKMGQVLDDDAMGEALARANQKAKEGKPLRPQLMEETYEQPFSEKRNTSPAQTPDWTPEKLDEYAIQQGRAQSWARRSRLGEFVRDPFETSDLPLGSQFYAVFTAFFVAFAYGRATPKFLADVLHIGTVSSAQGLQEILQIPGLVLALASVGSSVLCAVVLAPERNRGAIVWGWKGFLGGPLALTQLRGLDSLITREEEEEAAKAEYQKAAEQKRYEQ
mmetsp:Transcript_19238/g.53623  ORF Transcript_19238/g.53623 Transcript_19238/m.53623 type:complete len:412 (-) Transcript_19238:793-2028(-)